MFLGSSHCPLTFSDSMGTHTTLLSAVFSHLLCPCIYFELAPQWSLRFLWFSRGRISCLPPCFPRCTRADPLPQDALSCIATGHICCQGELTSMLHSPCTTRWRLGVMLGVLGVPAVLHHHESVAAP